MPYIIATRTTRFRNADHAPFSESRCAADTLDDVRAHIATLPSAHSVYYTPRDSMLPGPVELPDGTVINASFIAWIELARIVGLDCGELCATSNQDILDAYNARS